MTLLILFCFLFILNAINDLKFIVNFIVVVLCKPVMSRGIQQSSNSFKMLQLLVSLVHQP
jgi:hypothetical protein